MYVVEYINSCCFSHGEPRLVGKYDTEAEALVNVLILEKRTLRQMQEYDTHATEIRVLDLANYPSESYHSNITKHLYELEEDEKPEWEVWENE